MYDTDCVLAAAVRAHKQNNGFIKHYTIDLETGMIIGDLNKVLVRKFLKEPPSSEDLEEARRIRLHFQQLLFQKITGNLGMFLDLALQIANADSVSELNLNHISVAAAMPASYYSYTGHRDAVEQREKLAASMDSPGIPGHRVKGEFKIISSQFKKFYGCDEMTAVCDNKMYVFLHSPLLVGLTYRLGGILQSVTNNVGRLQRLSLIHI